MAALRPSPPTTARCARTQPGTLKPSVMHTSGSGSSAQSALPSAERFERCRPRRSICAAGMTMTATCAARLDDGLEELLTAGGGVPLGVVEHAERGAAATAQPVHVEAHRRRDERSGERPRPASSAPATNRTPRSRSCARRRRPGRDRLRRRGAETAIGLWYGVRRTGGRRRRPCCHESAPKLQRPPFGVRPRLSGSEQADAVRRPVDQERLADDVAARERAPVAAVLSESPRLSPITK